MQTIRAHKTVGRKLKTTAPRKLRKPTDVVRREVEADDS